MFAGVLDAIPLDENMQQDGVWSNHSVAFDALMEFADYTELEATQYIFDYFGHLTTGVAMMNPGWEQVGSGLDHQLARLYIMVRWIFEFLTALLIFSLSRVKDFPLFRLYPVSCLYR